MLNGFTEVHKDGRVRIYINKNLPRDMLRFVLAKELTHIMLPEDPDRTAKMTVDQILKDLEHPNPNLENYAKALIMPSEIVARLWPQIEEIEAMAKLFDVPVSVMSSRLNDLGISPMTERERELAPIV